ncbi:MAG: hypothetical protein QNJ54_25925 [Prochloraceae cyanobacterium]|nr:hypothetical protein [Prochloraceae cyanobacterium]
MEPYLLDILPALPGLGGCQLVTFNFDLDGGWHFAIKNRLEKFLTKAITDVEILTVRLGTIGVFEEETPS